uniref:glycoside hydrolase family 24 protein n=2 Tax=Flavobacterium sp. TaxID=239 RepID=UPI0040472CE5
YIRVKDENDKILCDSVSKMNEAALTLQFTPTAVKMVENKAAMVVGSSAIAVSSKDNKHGVCENEARVRAFMRAIKEKEGFAGDIGYETNCGGKSFIKDFGKNWEKHPDVSVYIARIGKNSDAAGAYQIMGSTWDDSKFKNLREQYGVNDFMPINQDKFALLLFKYKRTSKIGSKKLKELGWDSKYGEAYGDMIQQVIDKNLDKAILIAGLEWASLPGSPYGQEDKNYTNKDFIAIYDKFLKEEIIGKSDLKLKKGFLREFGYSNCIPLNAPDGIVTYRIYKDGIIEKHIPKNIKKGFENKYKYIYHGSKNVQNEICTVDWEEIDNVAYNKKDQPKSVPKGYTSSEDFDITGVNQKHLYKYADGSVIATGDAGEGGGTATKKYTKGTGKSILVKIPEPLNYDSKGVKVKMTFENTIRKYMGADHFAALIGALAECSYDSVISEGSAMKDGTCFPSTTHVNGQSIDTDYFYDSKGKLKQKEQQDFIDAFAKFGFKDFYYSPSMSFIKPKNTRKFSIDNHHKAHLHCGAEKITVLIIK